MIRTEILAIKLMVKSTVTKNKSTKPKAADFNNIYEKDIKAQDVTLRIDPQNETAWTNKGFALYLLNKYDEALASYDKAIELNPKDEAIWYFKGDALRDLGKYDEAQKAYDKAFKGS